MESYLLKEDGGKLLQETGDGILLEQEILTLNYGMKPTNKKVEDIKLSSKEIEDIRPINKDVEDIKPINKKVVVI